MSAWFEELTGPDSGPAIWIVAGLVLALLLVLALKLLRRVGSGAFAGGGRHRRTRLAVMDSAAVDDRRRLVLVRRDDVEHLILIGGPTDLVVEQDIRMVSAPRRPQPAEPDEPGDRAEAIPAPPPRPSGGEVQRPRLVPTPPAPPRPPQPAEPAAARPENGATRQPAAPVAPVRSIRQEPAVDVVKPTAASAPQVPAPRVEPAIARPAPAAEPRAGDNPAPPVNHDAKPAPRGPTEEEEALMREIEATLAGPESAPDRKQANGSADEMSLEEEMSRLLGDLSGERRQ